LIAYPSLYEGFGNALIETIYFHKPALVNRYRVYVDDIAPLGFRFAEIDGEVTDEAVAQVWEWLERPESAASATDHNYQVAAEHFSYDTLAQRLAALLPAVED
jgi:glycosyltransferase involved in cell wall biosynthesis